MREDTGELLAKAAGGDQAAWDELVVRHTGLLWSIARGFRLDGTDAADVVQTTWLRLVEHLDQIADPARLPGWLATTARRECLHLLRRGGREPKAQRVALFDLADPAPPVDEGVLRQERDSALWAALGQLTGRCQQLLRILCADPPPAYVEVSAALDMPVGSIGPARQRCLAQLRQVIAADPRLTIGAEDDERP